MADGSIETHDTFGTPRLAVINGLRGVAIGLVLSYHLIAGTMSPQSLDGFGWIAARLVSPLLTEGWTGVNLFFILSGFVLYLPYAAGQRTMHSLADRLAFYRRRAWRLLPLFYIAVLLEWAAAPGPDPRDIGELLSILSFGFIVSPHYFGPSFNPPLWSLGVEIAFSAVFPVLVAAQHRLGLGRLLMLVLATAFAFRFGGILRFPALQSPTYNSDSILCRIDEFVLGMAVAAAWVGGRLPRRPGGAATAGLLLVALAWLGFDQVLRGDLPPLARAGLNNVLDIGLCALLMAALAPRTRLARMLSWRPLQIAGCMSYSLYVWHLPLLRAVIPDPAALTAGALGLAIPIFLALALAAAAVSYRLIEFPPAAWRRRLRLGPSPRPA
ncbi:MAG: acyltransferase [Alphaproteobacteria bacterium]|nr:acyltransferase [Alphaproteobacteria bacterium]